MLGMRSCEIPACYNQLQETPKQQTVIKVQEQLITSVAPLWTQGKGFNMNFQVENLLTEATPNKHSLLPTKTLVEIKSQPECGVKATHFNKSQHQPLAQEAGTKKCLKRKEPDYYSDEGPVVYPKPFMPANEFYWLLGVDSRDLNGEAFAENVIIQRETKAKVKSSNSKHKARTYHCKEEFIINREAMIVFRKEHVPAKISHRLSPKRYGIVVTIPASVPAKHVSAWPSFPPARRLYDPVQLLVQNFSNLKRSGEPARFMRYVEESWLDVEAEVFEAVKAGFSKGVSSVETEIGGSKCVFDFHRMIEVNLDTGAFRSVAWIDVNGMCFFPKSIVCSHDGENGVVNLGEEPKNEVVGNVNESRYLVQPELEIEIEFTDDSQNEAKQAKSNKRKREIIEPEGNSSKEKGKNVQECELVSPRWPNTRVVAKQELGYEVTRDSFVLGMAAVGPGAMITAIHQRVRKGGSVERAEYDAFQKQAGLVRQARGNSKVVFAWLGTTVQGVHSIMSHGFGATGMMSGPGPLGAGLYLSPVRSPRMSALTAQVDENGEKHLVLCRVILGKCGKIEVGSLQLSHSRMDFDTGVDDLKNPQWYGVLCANHVLPEGFVQSNISENYTAGEVGNDGFMRELGSVVGDEVLRSTIQQIRG
nr:probable inactive poly [ADP-ribose] polymerase SRO3 [Ipomoea batatas]